MTKPTHPPEEAPLPYDTTDKGFVDRTDLKADAKPTGDAKTVKLHSPAGTAISTSEESAETLRGHGFT